MQIMLCNNLYIYDLTVCGWSCLFLFMSLRCLKGVNIADWIRPQVLIHKLGKNPARNTQYFSFLILDFLRLF